MKKFLGFIVVLAIIAAIAAPRVMDIINKEDTPEEAVTVVTVGGMQVLQGDLSNYVELIGSTSARESINVIPAVPALVNEVKVVIGDYVNADDVLLTLDPDSIEDQIAQAEIGVTMANVGVKNANAGINQAQIGYDLSLSNYNMQLASYEFGVANVEKYEAMFAEGIVTSTELEQVKLQASPETLTMLQKQLEQAEAGLTQAKLGAESAAASLKQAKLGVSSAKDMLVEMTLNAPISGFITASTVSNHNFASNAQPAMVIQNIDDILINVSVTQSLINQLALGDEVEVQIDALNDEKITGTIETLSTAADQRTLLYPLTVKVTNTDHKIKPGMFATVIIPTDSATNALYVPAEAVLLRDEAYYVYLVRGSDKVERLEVQVGVDTGYFTEIKEGVLLEDIIITKGLGLIDENSTIKVIRSDQE